MTPVLDGLRSTLTLRGLVALAVGLLALVWPGTALAALVVLFGAFVLVDGLALLYAAVRGGGAQRWLLGLQGLVGVLAAVVAFGAPQATVVAAVYVFGAWAILTGLLGAAVALRLAGVVPGAGLLGVGGVLSVALGVLLLRSPDAGALFLARLFGAYQVAAGVVQLTLAARLRRAGRRARADRIGSPAAA
jgi:uncharacterized membrane protein HdeD (DUF308 family)